MIIKGKTFIEDILIYRYNNFSQYLEPEYVCFLSVSTDDADWIIGRHPDCGYHLGDVFAGDWHFMVDSDGEKVRSGLVSLVVPMSKDEKYLVGLI